MPKITEAEYVKQNGGACPFCQNTDGNGVEADGSGYEYVDGGGVCQDVTCRDCGREWTEYFQISGYSPRCKTCRSRVIPPDGDAEGNCCKAA